MLFKNPDLTCPNFQSNLNRIWILKSVFRINFLKLLIFSRQSFEKISRENVVAQDSNSLNIFTILSVVTFAHSLDY